LIREIFLQLTYRKFITVICFGLLSITGEAQVSSSVSSGCAPLTGVVFNNSYPLATNINWDFDDGASSNLPNPSHNFGAADIYNVIFTALVNGNPVSDTIVITVHDIPSVNFTVGQPSGGCTGLEVSFTDNSQGGSGSPITTWQWAYGDGGLNTINTGNPLYQYNVPGLFDISLIVTDENGCVGSAIVNDAVSISSPPAIAISTIPSPATACAPPLEVQFIANATSNSPLTDNLTYEWDFDNGQTSVLDSPPSQLYNTEGENEVALTVTDDNNCSGMATIPVSLVYPIASFTADGGENDTVCSSVFFTNNSNANSWVYDYGDGNFGFDNFHEYEFSGWNNVTIEVQSGDCIDSSTISIYVQIPEAFIDLSVDTICLFPNAFEATGMANYSIALYDWILPSGNSSSLPVVGEDVDIIETYYSINQATEVDLQLVITTYDGCVDTTNVSLVLAKPNALFFPLKNEGCAPLGVTLDDYSTSDFSDIVTWTWHFGDNSPDSIRSDTSSVDHVYLSEGIYYPYLIVATENGCIDTSWAQTIFVGVPPVPSFTLSATDVCRGDVIQVIDTTSPADSVDTWNFNGDYNTIFSCSNDSIADIKFMQETGTDTITMTVGYRGCFSSTTQVVNVHGPVGNLRYTCNCDTPYNYPFEAVVEDATSWTWDFGDGQSLTDTLVMFNNHEYDTTGNYWAVLTTYNDTNGCPPDIDSLYIKVRKVEAIFDLPDSICAGIDIYFPTSLSKDAASQEGSCYNSFTWFFDDNTAPKTTNIGYNHRFDNSGAYNIQLWAQDINGCVDSTSEELHVFAIQSEFTYTVEENCLPIDVVFSSLSLSDLPITNYEWNFGDGEYGYVENPTHTYDSAFFNNAGIITPYQISLKITDEIGCQSTTDQQIAPEVPKANFTALTASTICEGQSITFDPVITQGGNTFLWSFGDGNFSNQYNPAHVYNQPGDFDVSLLVTSVNGCINGYTEPLYAHVQGIPVAGFDDSLGEGEALCYPAQVTFTDTSWVDPFGSREWDLGNGTPTVGLQSIGANYYLPGTYTVTLIERTTAGCADTVAVDVHVSGPIGSIILQENLICRGGDIQLQIADTSNVMTWQWDFGNGVNQNEVSPVNYNYDYEFNPASGQTIISLVMWSEDSLCNKVASDTLSFVQIEADFLRNNEVSLSDSMHCPGIQDSFFDLSSVNVNSWFWDFGNGETFNGQNPPPLNYSTGAYDVSLIVQSNPEGCIDTMTKTMTIFPLPEVQATGEPFCKGNSTELLAYGGENYNWTPTEFLDNPNSDNPMAFPDSTTEFFVTVTDSNGCVNQTSTIVTVYQPILSQNQSFQIIIGESVTFEPPTVPGYTYSWSPELWISCIDCQYPIAQPLEDTVYVLTMTDSLDCFHVQSGYQVDVLPLSTVDVPDVFTPNGDGINDIIYVKGWGIEDLISFQIFNRWGELVFETSDVSIGWDGTYKGKIQSADTYAYVIKAKTYITFDIIQKEGYINIIE
jgi:gliding motility-associated-like protein